MFFLLLLLSSAVPKKTDSYFRANQIVGYSFNMSDGETRNTTSCTVLHKGGQLVTLSIANFSLYDNNMWLKAMH